MKQPTLRENHQRLVAIMEMIEKCDSRIVNYKRSLYRYDEPLWRNEHAKYINRFRRVRIRLYKAYANVIINITERTIQHQDKHSYELQ